LYTTETQENGIRRKMQSNDFIQKIIQDERNAIVERLFKEKAHVVDLGFGKRMVYIAEEVIAAIKNREL
jgi:hypothetical protein